MAAIPIARAISKRPVARSSNANTEALLRHVLQ